MSNQRPCYPIRLARTELKARVRKRFLSKDQLRVQWDFSHATLTFQQGTRGYPPSLSCCAARSGKDRRGLGEGSQAAAGSIHMYFISG